MGYKVCKFERDGKKGGGLALLLNKCTCKRVNTHTISNKYHSFESIMCTTIFDKICYNIINIYRPPSESKSEFIEQFESFLEHVLQNDGLFVIFGDFNIDLLTTNKTTNDFLSILERFDLIQLIEQPTRELSLLDYVIINYVSKDKF